MSNQPLTASYTSPTSTQTFSHELPATRQENASVEEKTLYLAELRSSAMKLQGEVNVFLTRKMDEDKLAEEQKGSVKAKKKNKKDEDREEEMYGEEDPEQDG